MCALPRLADDGKYQSSTGMVINEIRLSPNFTSDHGEMFGSHGRHRKLIFYEEAARIPFLIRWPARIKPHTVYDVC